MTLPFFILIGADPAEAERSPVPNAAAQEFALREIKAVLKAQYAKAKKPTEKVALLKSLQQQESGTQSDEASHFVLLTEIETLSLALGEIDAALEAIDKLAAKFEIEAFSRKQDALNKVVKTAKSTDQNQAVMTAATALIDEALANNKFDTLDDLGTLALTAARRTKSKEIVAQATAQVRELDDLKKVLPEVTAALKVMADKPDDPAANLTVGKFRCFQQGDWKAGLPLLARGADKQLRDLAEQDLADPKDPQAQVKLGDAWLVLAENEKQPLQTQLQIRGGDWLGRALPQLAGLDKTRVEKQFIDLQKTLAPRRLKSVVAGAILILTFDEPTCQTSGGVFRAKDLVTQKYRTEFSGKAKLQNGQAGQAIEFDRGYGMTAGEFPLESAPRTVCAWAKFYKPEGEHFAFDYGDPHHSRQFGAGTSQLFWEACADRGSGRMPTTVRADGEWHHHALIYDGSQMTYYLDGKQMAQKEIKLETIEAPFMVGNRGDRQYPMIGLVDDLIVFSRPLTSSEIQTLYFTGLSHRPLVK